MADWKLSARKAGESRIKATLGQAGVAIHFTGGDAFDPAQHQRYIRFTNHGGRRIVREMGRTPRIEGPGFWSADAFTRPQLKEDGNDLLASAVQQAFPYGEDLFHDGFRVQILEVDRGDFVEAAGWGYSPVRINWVVWRT